jgi:hypothetical protein
MNTPAYNDNDVADRQTMKNLRTVILSLVGVTIGLIVAVTVIASYL